MQVPSPFRSSLYTEPQQTAGHAVRPLEKINPRKHLIVEDQVRDKKGLEIIFFKAVPVFNIQVNSMGTGKRLLWVRDKITLRFKQTICFYFSPRYHAGGEPLVPSFSWNKVLVN